MRRLLLSLLVVSVIFSVKTVLSWELDAQTGFNNDWWEDTKDTKARQFYVPLRIEGRQDDFSFRVLTAYADTRFDPPEARSRSLSHLLDTKLNFSYQFVDKLPVDLVLGLDFNLPTGKTDLNERDLDLIMDPDLISINNFGEGFNVNPTVAIAKEWGNWVAGLGVGYVFRGTYDFSRNIRNLDPGDIINGNAEIRYDFSSRWNARFFSGIAWFDKDKWRRRFAGRQRHQEGLYLLLGSGVQYVREKWDAGFTLRAIFRDKSKFQEFRGLAKEDRNSHGDEWVADLSYRRLLTDRNTLKFFLQGLLITDNDYPSTSLLFIGASPNRFIGRRQKLTLGLSVSRMLSSRFEAELYGKGFVMHDEKTVFPEPRRERSFRGLSAGLRFVFRF